MADHPSYGDVLRRDPADPDRDQIRATPDWTPVAIPGRPGWWRHCIAGQQVDAQDYNPPTSPGAAP